MIALILTNFECNIFFFHFMLNMRKSSEDDYGFDGFDGAPILASRLFLVDIVFSSILKMIEDLAASEVFYVSFKVKLFQVVKPSM